MDEAVEGNDGQGEERATGKKRRRKGNRKVNYIAGGLCGDGDGGLREGKRFWCWKRPPWQDAARFGSGARRGGDEKCMHEVSARSPDVVTSNWKSDAACFPLSWCISFFGRFKLR